MRFSAEIAIDARPEDVWAVYADVTRWPEWTKSVTSVTPLDPGPLHLGQRVRISQPKLPTTVWTVTALDEGRSWEWTATGPLARTVATHVVTAEGDGSRASNAIDQSGLLGVLIGKLAGGLTDRYLVMEAEGLKARAESAAR
ncbi:SRPBCC family protein [Actinokineospora sp. HUAS TT18]|uniref:SRPBCC family protein n=1 Tax=Actinokineospora sp. HUAS TT18 TaxID=3447451 RepID=UPI003F51EBB1